ncbi:hypothetical protein HMI01_10630 [Halolactibacillus miurensis]|uniref:Helix-turn-helix domain-containing protein n=1 Tax=Halolactibacillus miurensis TaxID=306541 RepID=A0ABQ0VT16_9BACI|nr:hypothetical protein HMI01_10630 [Halolactibacillus miurensis]
MILQVHQLHKQGFSISAISRKCDMGTLLVAELVMRSLSLIIGLKGINKAFKHYFTS